ncbi:MAG TPA: lipopolysaccharide biosynthesis protein [Candidatus Angelobacter sp.]|nr:lipopolysaccharide biosynthesis protein [Candidatus Angelobacter sp.]
MRRLGRGEGRAFVAHNLVAAVGTGLAGVFSLLLQAVLTHRLNVRPYGQMLAVFTFFTLITQPAQAFGRLVAWRTSRELATAPGVVPGGALLRSVNRRLLVFGTVLGGLLALFSPAVASFLQVPADFVVIAAVSVPFTLAGPALLGAVQGEQRFGTWGVLVAATAGSRIVCAAALVVPFGVRGALAGISLASVLVYAWTLWTVRAQLRQPGGVADWRAVRRFLVVAIASTLTIATLLSCDVVMVSHYFSARQAGQYGAMAVAARAMFFAMGSVSSVLFPKVAARHAVGRGTLGLVATSLGVSLLGGLAGWAVFSAFADVILRVFAGHMYTGASGSIGLYALGTALLAGAAMLSNTQQSLDRLRLLWVLVPGAFLEPVLIVLFHGSLQQVVAMGDIAVGVVLVALAVLYLVEEGHLARVGARARARVSSLRAGSWLDRPWKVGAGLAAVGLLVRHAWLTGTPLSAGDWSWPDTQRLVSFWPFGSPWDSTQGLGGQNRFLDVFRLPVQAFAGLLAQLGIGWSWSEKVLYFVPFAVLLPLSGWLLAREVMGRTRWALLTPLLMLGNTYMLLVGNGEVPLALAEVCAILALVAFLRCMRMRSVGWALLFGLALGACAVFDVRGAYLGAVLALVYLAVLLLAERSLALLVRRCGLFALALATFAGTQAFWLLPLLTYHGNPGFPTPQAPDFNILTLGHGIAGVGTAWTGGQPSSLVQASLNPLFMLIPLLALAPLLASRLRVEVVWLAVVAVLFAFFAKTDTPPLGGLYDWMYLHVPGWKLFREGSKFLFCVAMAEAVLVPVALRMAVARGRELGAVRLGRALRYGAVACAWCVALLALWPVGVLQTGALLSTTQPTPVPSSFAALSALVAADSRPGAIAYVGQPVVAANDANHRFLVASQLHPAVNLTGSFTDTRANRRDPFQSFCANASQPYCYLDAALFPYLAETSQLDWVVAPGGAAAGTLPAGVTRAWLRDALTSLYGAPSVLGSGDTSLLAWHVASPVSAVAASPAVAVVDSGPWALRSVLPALQALQVPAVYRQSFDSRGHPGVAGSLPDSVAVSPLVDGSCVPAQSTPVAVMARGGGASLSAVVGGRAVSLPLLAAAAAAPGWGFYGPVTAGAGSLTTGAKRIAAPGPTPATGTTPGSAPPDSLLGPCVEWSPLTTTLLAPHAIPTQAVHTTSNGEQLSTTLPAARAPWVELRRPYDPGWRLHGAAPTALADGLFTLYHPPGGAAQTLSFQFSTLPWERLGLAATLLVTAIAAATALFALRRHTKRAELPDLPVMHSPVAAPVAAAGLLLLTITALAVTIEWLGLPSAAAGLDLATDPYALDVGFGAAALGLLAVSLVVRCLAPLAASGLRIPVIGRATSRTTTTARKTGIPIALSCICIAAALLVSACGTSTTDAVTLLNDAQQAGEISTTLTAGESLDDARLQRAVRDPQRCIADYTRALPSFTDLASAYAGRAVCYTGGGANAPAAVHDYTQAIALSPDDAALLLGRAAAQRAAGDLTAAATDYRAAAAHPAATAAQILAAVDGLLVIGQDSDAAAAQRIGAARFAKAVAPTLAAADIAQAAGDDPRVTSALLAAQHLATTDPEHAAVLARLCHVDVLRHQTDAALTDCASAAQLGNDRAGAYDDLATADLAIGNPTQALADMDRAVSAFTGKVGPDAQPTGVHGFGIALLDEARGWILVEMGRKHDAVVAFQHAQRMLPPTAASLRARLSADLDTARANP